MKKTVWKFSMAAAVVLLLGSLMLEVARAQAGAWTEDYQKALQIARQEHKLVLMDFTGSDWCGWCMKLHEDVFSKPEFNNYAAKNLVLLKIDFPSRIAQSEVLKKQNAALQKEFKVEGYPTLVVLSSDGKKLGQFVGYEEGGPQHYIEAIEKLR